MIMKWLNFNSIIGMAVLSLLFYTENVAAQTDKNDTKQKIDTIQTTQPEYSKYDKRIHRFRKGWNSLIPTHNKIQYAGNMGMFSFGTGWDYGKRDQWETDLFFGFIPKHDSHRAKMTMTLKQNYMPWSLELGKGFSYMGRQFRLEVGQQEFFPDLLFYNAHLHAYVVIELKARSFHPSFLGQLSFYVSAVNHQFKTDIDNPTIGFSSARIKTMWWRNMPWIHTRNQWAYQNTNSPNSSLKTLSLPCRLLRNWKRD